MRVLPGDPAPLGATWDGAGVNFALYSAGATGVDLCLFDADHTTRESARIELTARTGNVWHGRLPEVGPGQLYGYRVRGPYDAPQGFRFNPAKLLIDPYARALTRPVPWTRALLGHTPDSLRQSPSPSQTDSAPVVPKCIVVDPAFSWGDDRPPRTPWEDTLIYEVHVRGMTIGHPNVEERLRGTYQGLASEPVIAHLRSLGVTAVQLMPAQQAADDEHLASSGLTNYWGYSPVAWLAPDARFATTPGEQVREFQTMVQRLHAAGIEVILDVPFNHTGECDDLGPTLSLRGIDNATYYRLDPERLWLYTDMTGCGNTVNVSNPVARQLILDALRYWVDAMHVDGFRFDLAPALLRDPLDVNPAAPLLEMIRADPMLSRAKLIAEPWDLGPSGYQLGRFPPAWSEWNDQYRDTVRRFWRGDSPLTSAMATRLAGSSDVFHVGGRGPRASINYVAVHDGFTLRDVVSYEAKHNEANGYRNADGMSTNNSRNWGVEGETDVPAVLALRARAERNLLATLAFSQGVPMLSHGDELGRTQHGNNNAYAQDSEVTWVNWRLDDARASLLEFTRSVFAVRRATRHFRRLQFFDGRASGPGQLKDVAWFRPDGWEIDHADWNGPAARAFAMLLGGATSITTSGPLQGQDATAAALSLDACPMLLLLSNAADPVTFALPAPPELPAGHWEVVIDTGVPAAVGDAAAATPGLPAPTSTVTLAAYSLVLLRRRVTRPSHAP